MVAISIQCRKDKRIPFCEQYPDECVDILKIKDHFYFDVGTYWIYQEENSGQIDSQWVSISFTDSGESWFNYTVKSNISDHHQRFWTVLLDDTYLSGLVNMHNTSAYVKRSKSKPGGFIGESYISIFYPEVGDSVGNYSPFRPNNQIIIDSIYEKIKYLGNDYHNILKINEYSNAVENFQPTIHYYAKYVGLVRKELLDSNEVWNLINYHIVQ